MIFICSKPNPARKIRSVKSAAGGLRGPKSLKSLKISQNRPILGSKSAIFCNFGPSGGGSIFDFLGVKIGRILCARFVCHGFSKFLPVLRKHFVVTAHFFRVTGAHFFAGCGLKIFLKKIATLISLKLINLIILKFSLSQNKFAKVKE